MQLEMEKRMLLLLRMGETGLVSGGWSAKRVCLSILFATRSFR